MVKYELMNLLLQDFPESIVEIMACFAFLKLKFEWKKILIIALLQTIINLVRDLPIVFGLHTVILLISLTIFIRVFTRQRLLDVFKATILSFLIILGLEVIYVGPLLTMLNVSYEQAFSTPTLRALCALPYEIFLLIIALVVNYKNNTMGDGKLELSRHGINSKKTSLRH